MKEIRFYSPKKPYGCLGNYSRHPLKLGTVMYLTLEHAYQCFKFWGSDPEYARSILGAYSPLDATKLGATRDHCIVPWWDRIRIDVMESLLHSKVTQNTEVRSTLLGTKCAELIYASPLDYYWGIGRDGTGKNYLGSLLEGIRTELLEGIRDL